MARRFINTAKYRPITYQELAAPAEAATLMLSSQASALDATMSENEKLHRFLDPELDKEEYAVVKDNEAKLYSAMENLKRNGLNSGNFGMFRSVNKIYSQRIQPIEAAVASRVDWTSKMNTFLSEHPDTAIKGGLIRPLSEFYTGTPKADFVIGRDIQKDVADVAEAVANGINGIYDAGSFDRYNNIVKTITGVTLDEYLAMKDNPKSLLNSIVHDVLIKHGVTDYQGNNLMDNPDDYNKMVRYAMDGTYKLIGKTSYQLHDNGRKHLESLAASRASARATGGSGRSSSGKTNNVADGWSLSDRIERTGRTVQNGQQKFMGEYHIPVLKASADGNWGDTILNTILAHLDQSDRFGRQDTKINGPRGEKLSLAKIEKNLSGKKTISITLDLDLQHRVANRGVPCYRVTYGVGKDDYLLLQPELLGVDHNFFTNSFKSPTMQSYLENPDVSPVEQEEAYKTMENMLNLARSEFGENIKIEHINK